MMARKKNLRTVVPLVTIGVLCAAAWGSGMTAEAGEPLKKVNFGWFPAAHTAHVFVAKHHGIFEKEGLDVEMIRVSTGIQLMGTLLSGDTDMSVNHLGGVAQLHRQGKKPMLVYAYTIRPTQDLTVRSETLARLGVSRADPLPKRLAALKGLKMGVTSPRSESDLFSRYLLRLGGLDPERDVSIISIGAPANLIAALKTGQIDSLLQTPPIPTIPVVEGFGQVLISLARGDVPEFRNFPYTGVVLLKEYAQKNPDTVVRFVRALMKADAILRTNKEGTIAALRAFLGGEPKVLSATYDALLDSWTRPEASALSKPVIETQMGLWQKLGVLEFAATANEGEMWTNEYRDRAFATYK
jgi:NitT/TauT family transport system substrate-binding protein